MMETNVDGAHVCFEVRGLSKYKLVGEVPKKTVHFCNFFYG